KIIIIIGNQDLTAGEKFAKYLYNSTPHITENQKLLLKQYQDKHNSKKIKATHVEPVSPDKSLDTGNRNFIITGALALGKIDEVDKNCYWRLSGLLIKCINEEFQTCNNLFQNPSLVTSMGTWGDETPIKPMKIMH
ncbi:MAG: hypothetical protein SFU99_07160, partial [Saprospiraceae bacterium]|nr:hypothetical protein [Saprospiraceae bacterium]